MDELKKMREPFPDHQIGKLAKGSKAQMQCDVKEKTNCKICGGFHHPKLIHLDYVGHAALTDRLLDCDPLWTWEPLAYCEKGLPCFDENGGLWIKLTICGHTRIGYGNAEPSQYKEVGSREKEVIGDALRNAAMRFGAALELWHKGQLHEDDKPPEPDIKEPQFWTPEQQKQFIDICSKKEMSNEEIEKLRTYIIKRQNKKGNTNHTSILFTTAEHVIKKFDAVFNDFIADKF